MSSPRTDHKLLRPTVLDSGNLIKMMQPEKYTTCGIICGRKRLASQGYEMTRDTPQTARQVARASLWIIPHGDARLPASISEPDRREMHFSNYTSGLPHESRGQTYDRPLLPFKRASCFRVPQFEPPENMLDCKGKKPSPFLGNVTCSNGTPPSGAPPRPLRQAGSGSSAASGLHPKR